MALFLEKSIHNQINIHYIFKSPAPPQNPKHLLYYSIFYINDFNHLLYKSLTAHVLLYPAELALIPTTGVKIPFQVMLKLSTASGWGLLPHLLPSLPPSYNQTHGHLASLVTTILLLKVHTSVPQQNQMHI